MDGRWFSVGGDGGTIARTETKLDVLVLHDVTKMEEGECRRLTELQSQEAALVKGITVGSRI
jgi:hypothetical protein